MQEVTWYVSVIFLTLLQHETAVVLWYHRFFNYFQNRFTAAVEVFVIVGIVDFFWLYLQFLLFRKSLDKLSHVARIHAWLARVQMQNWFVKLKPYFVNEKNDADAGESRFKRMLRNSGYFGILLCASLPGPGFKELGIVMALAPKYKDHGFAVMYAGGLIKTILTLLIYTGLYHAFEKLFENAFR